MATETVTINSVNLNHDGAWKVRDYTPLYERGPARGANIVVPGASGETARPLLRGALNITLPLYIFATEIGETSTPTAASRDTLAANIDYLTAQLLAPYSGGAATVTLTHTRTDASTTSGAVQGVALTLNPHDGLRGLVVRAVLSLVVPAGELT
jgi:hypothetical protein